MQDIVSMWYVAARKLSIVVGSPVTFVRYCPENGQLIIVFIVCPLHHFGTILPMSPKSKYYFDVDKSAINFNLQEMKNCVTSQSL